ncbi:MAG: hypothetical protein RR450_04715 [Oscillospiraceae bacterium]
MNYDERGHWEPSYVDPLQNVSATPQTVDPLQNVSATTQTVDPLISASVTTPPKDAVPEDTFEHNLPPYLSQDGEPSQAPLTPPESTPSITDFGHDLDAILAEVLSSAPPANDAQVNAVPEYIVPDSAAPEYTVPDSGTSENIPGNEGQTPENAMPYGGGYVPPWAVQEADREIPQEIPATPRANVASDMRSSVNMAIANVFETIQQGGSGSDAPFRGETQHRMQPGHNFDPETAAAVASAMASVFADLGKTRFSVQSDEVEQAPSQPRTGNYGSPTNLDDIVSSIMAEATRKAPPRQVSEEDDTIVDAEVHSVTDNEAPQTADTAQNSTPPPSAPNAKAPEPTEQSSVFTPPTIHSEDAQAWEVSSAPKKGKKVKAPKQAKPPKASKAPKQPKHLNSSKASSPSRRTTDAGARGRRRPQKYVIAAGAKAKGMSGKFTASKRSLNMAMKVKTMSSPSRLIPLTLCLIIFVAAFGKFGVIDQLNRVDRAEQSFAALQSQIDTLAGETAGYTEMEKEYSLYGSKWMTPEEIAQVDVLYGLDVCRKELLPTSRVESIVIAQNIISVNLSGITLQQASAIIKQVEAYTLVKEAFVSSASSLDVAAAAPSAATPPITPEEPIIPEEPILPGMPPMPPTPTVSQPPAAPQAPATHTPIPTPGFDNGKNTKITLSIILEDPATAIPEETPTPPEEGGTN